MSIRTPVARTLLVLLASGGATVPAARAGEADGGHAYGSSAAVAPGPAPAAGGLLLGRLSRGDRRLWRAVEQVVAASDAAGAPRSPTLRRLWEWARTSTHAVHVELVSPSKLAAGMAGIFSIERVDPAGLRHVGVIRLCPSNIERARASSGPNAVLSFARFDGLTDAERYAEVLAHELAHAEYLLESPVRLAEVQAAQAAVAVAYSRVGRSDPPVYEDLVRRCEEPLAVLAAGERHAESVEAVVVRELARKARVETR